MQTVLLLLVWERSSTHPMYLSFVNLFLCRCIWCAWLCLCLSLAVHSKVLLVPCIYIYLSYSPVNKPKRMRMVVCECGFSQTEQTFMSIRALVQNALIGMNNCLAVVIYFPFIVISFTLRYRTKCGKEWRANDLSKQASDRPNQPTNQAERMIKHRLLFPHS